MKISSWEELQEKQKKLKEAEHLLYEEGRKCAPVPQYRYHVVVMEPRGSWDPIFQCTECIQIVGELLNGAEKEAHMRKYGSINGWWNDATHSVTYFRINGQLCHTGGGHLFLKTPQPCSDEQWETLKKTADWVLAGLLEYND